MCHKFHKHASSHLYLSLIEMDSCVLSGLSKLRVVCKREEDGKKRKGTRSAILIVSNMCRAAIFQHFAYPLSRKNTGTKRKAPAPHMEGGTVF